MRISTALTLFVLSSLPVSASSAREGLTPFDLLEDGSLIVPVTIAGTGNYRFVVDTGSSRTVISTRLWQELRLPVVAKTIMVTPAGRDFAYVVKLRGLAIGGQPGVDVDAAVMRADQYAAGQRVDGLIGQDLLARAVYTIDYERRAIVWHSGGDALPGVRLPLQVRDNRVLVDLPQNTSDDRPLSLIPDSGSDGLVLFAHARDKVKMKLLDVGVLSSVSGTRLVRRAEIGDLTIGEERIQNPLATLVDTGEANDLMGDGLLPLHIFARVTINVPERYLIVHSR